MTFDCSDETLDRRYIARREHREHEVVTGVQFTAHDVAMCSSEDARTFLTPRDAFALRALPLALVRGRTQLSLHIAVAEDSEHIRSKLRFLCGLDVVLTAVSVEILEQAIPKAYYGSELRLRRYIDRIAAAPRGTKSATNDGLLGGRTGLAAPEAKGDAAQFLTAILEFAAVRGASDLHLSPGQDSVVAKMRIDGEICSLEGDPYAKSFHEQVISRLKVLAALDVTNRRLPQDGAFRFMVGSTARSARVSTLPSVHGESAVIRLLDGHSIPEIGSLGFEPTTLLVLRAALDRTEGLILLTGPTGSGKTTTMYSVVRELARRGHHVVTVEDPVENPLPDTVQVQVCTEQGLDYPRAIRSVLRHDPDVLLIGEMRDGVSASMALDAASTGHLTVSSLHVGSSLQAIGRLEVLGVPRARSVPAVAVIVNQRLLPRLCQACKERDDGAVGGGASKLGAVGGLFRAVGCETCGGTGYVGRVLVTELLDIQSQRAKDACYRATTTAELLEALPVGACIPWSDSLQHHLVRGDISLAQLERFVQAEMV
jgi:type II secretory ATPase GspE/PulE/Tfp pilus assembly ATPase PilB-like protein